MSVSLYFTPTKKGQKAINGDSSNLCALEETFGSPLRLSREDLPQLRAMRNAARFGWECYSDLIDALEVHEEILVEGKW